MSADQSIPAPPRPGGGKNMSLILSVVAVVVAAAALGAAVALPGPAGPAGSRGATGTNGTNGTTGARGPQGPTGNGTLMAHFLQITSFSLTASCTSATANASLTVPSKGNVTITASVTVQISHTSGTMDAVYVFASTSRFGGCSDTAGYAVVPSSAATDTYYFTVAVALASPVASAGTYTYTVGAIGAANDAIYFASGYAVFYPG